jgi:hypothetical protein
LLHLLNPESVDLTIYDDGEVSGTDLRDGHRATVEFGRLSTAVADALRAESLRVPDSLRLVAISGEAKAVCGDGRTILYGVFNSGGQEVVFRKSQNCREYAARPRDEKLGATLYRFSEILRGWELTVGAPY